MELIRSLLIGFSSSSCRLSTRTMSEPVDVGMRTDSAMKPMFFISGITRPRARAAPVVVRMMLFRIERLFRRSLAPAEGSLSSTCWLPVAACTVTMEALKKFSAPKWSINGLIM